MRKNEKKYFKNLRRALLATGILSLLLTPSFAAPVTSVFSANKNPPEGFSEIVEPNVLLLIDTSGSMTFFMHSEDSTYGDGTQPFGDNKYYGKDRHPGKNTAGTNNVISEENMEYHPNLRYIPDSDISRIDGSYKSIFAYDELETTHEIWNKLTGTTGLPSIPKEGTTNYQYSTTGSGNNARVVIQSNTGIFGSWSTLGEFNDHLRSFFGADYRYNSTSGLEKNTHQLEKDFGYKYPNDSRMYVLKNVLYRILGEPTLVEGLRLGLASYYQTTHSGGTNADWYKWNPQSNGSAQKITSKNGGSKRAILRENFKSTSHEPGHLEKIREWFDGIETSVNKEFRADGGTPLADSIYNSSGNSAYHYIKNAIQYWCQDNWLVVFTDGADDDIAGNPNKAPKAVDDLYKANLGINNARPIKTMVIGLVDKDASSNAAFVASLEGMAANGRSGRGAFFANDMDKLYSAFKTIFKTIQDVKATGSAPLVNPPTSAGEGGMVYSTGFKPSSVRQWTGSLSAFSMTDGEIKEEPDWEVGETLPCSDKEGSANCSDRNVLTTTWGGGSAGSFRNSNLQVFSSGNKGALIPLLKGGNTNVTNPQGEDFIKWVLGEDVWEETESGKRWKLGDPYHVGLTEVGPPHSRITDPAYKAFVSQISREPIIYMHANDGMLHAFRVDDGYEEWAFIPPNVLNYPRLLGTKLYDNGTFINHALSNPKYLLDGPLIAEDVLIDGSYKTVLLGALGRAGAGLYAMDVTDPQNPRFLWAVDNNVYDESENLRPTGDRTFLKWTGGSGTGPSSLSTTPSSNSISANLPGRLRLTVSTPFIGAVDLKKDLSSSLETQWIALLGAGAKLKPGSETGDDGGTAVVALNIKDGSLLAQLSHSDLGAVVAPISIEAGVRPMRIKNFYLGDDGGSIFEGDLSPFFTSNWSLNPVFRPGDTAPAEDIFTIPYAVEIGTIKNRKWLFWGTGDPDWIFDRRDGQCYIFGMNKSLAGNSVSTLEDLLPLKDKGTDNFGDPVADSPMGWRMVFDEEKEMISTPPVLFGGYIFFATYIPKGDDPCAVGDSKFYIMKGDTGEGGFVTFDSNGNPTSRKKSVKLAATRVSGITISEGKLYVGVTGFSSASNPREVFKDYTNSDSIKLSENLLVFDIPEYIQESASEGSSTKTEPAYWRDWRP